ncbi:MAG: hypothetical protein M3P30_14460 [Chloroflexota bacterium]|nr:hypothetical protein [Chloroflexota bacterium]
MPITIGEFFLDLASANHLASDAEVNGFVRGIMAAVAMGRIDELHTRFLESEIRYGWGDDVWLQTMDGTKRFLDDHPFKPRA